MKARLKPMALAAAYSFLMPRAVALVAFWEPVQRFLRSSASGTLAAWLQAVGGIATIAAGFAVLAIQLGANRAAEARRAAQQLRETRQRVLAYCHLFDQTRENALAGLRSGKVRNPASVELILGSFENLLAGMMAYDPPGGDFVLVQLFYATRGTLTAARDRTRAVYDGFRDPGNDVDVMISDLVVNIGKLSNLARANLSYLQKHLGALTPEEVM
jgi:hypothetical protein